MAVGIIDLLEVVDVEHGHVQLFLFLPGLVEHLLAAIKEIASIGQSGKKILGRQILQRANQFQIFYVLGNSTEELFPRERLVQEIVGPVF